MIGNMLQDWQENPTLTTLESIAAPIQDIPFSTVTVCPEVNVKPDVWAYPELILNAIPYECYDYGYTRYPECNETLKARKDFVQVLSKLSRTYLRRLIAQNNYQGLLEHENLDDQLFALDFYSHDPTNEQKLSCMVKKKKLNYKRIEQAAIDNFVKVYDKGSDYDLLHNVLDKLVSYSSVDEFMDYGKQESYDPHCWKQTQITNMYSELGRTLLSTRANMPLGRFLANFAVLVDADKGLLSYDNRVADLDRDQSAGICGSLTQLDKLIHGYLANLTGSLGISRNSSSSSRLSMLDIPAILTRGHNYLKDGNGPSGIRGYAYSLCQFEPQASFPNVDKSCDYMWIDFYRDGIVKNPCENKDYIHFCCHHILDKVGHDLTSLMKVMRLANRRGQSLIDVQDLLQTYLDSDDHWKRYQFNKVGKGFYRYNMAYDPTAYIRACSFAKELDILVQKDDMNVTKEMQSCFMFEPVLTDQGICYAFNAKSMDGILQPSAFNKAFLEAYKTEISPRDKSQRLGLGTGDALSLFFAVDNNAMLRRFGDNKDGFSFNIAFGSSEETLQFSTKAKQVKPGYFLAFEVEPVEMVADPDLKDIAADKRGCNFPEDTDGFVTLFTEYSQPGCQFECMLKFAWDFCKCTPWDMPGFPGQNQTILCDTYSTWCFLHAFKQRQHLKDCHCPIDCNTVKYSVDVDKKKVELDSDQTCLGYLKDLDLKGMWSDKFDYWQNDLLYTFYTLTKHQSQSKVPITRPEDLQELLCREMLEKNIALIRVNFASNTYIKSVINKRVSFADQLGSLGKVPSSLDIASELL